MSDLLPKSEFDQYAENYDRALQQGISVSGEDKDFFARARVKWLSNRLKKRDFKARKIIDFGCGTGAAAPHLLLEMNPEQLLGLDVSAGLLNVAGREHGGERVKFQQLAKHVPDASTDLAFCNGVFHHIPIAERPAAMQHIFESLRSGGLFALWENNPWNPGTRYVMSRIPFDRDAITLSPPTARSLMREAGFELLTTDFLFIFPRVLSWLRWIEPTLCRLPLGAQYLILGRKP